MPELTILEPLSTGDIIDRALRVYRKNFLSLVGIVAVPTLIYYTSAMMISIGYMGILQNPTSGLEGGNLLLVGLGMLGYFVWICSIVVCVASASRAIGDYVMLGQPITFRGCFRLARGRKADIALLGVLTLLLMMVLGVVTFVIILGLMFGVALVGMLLQSGAFPEWLAVTIGTILTILVIAGAVFAFLICVARFVFIPHIVMIEGKSPFSSMGRAFTLGAKNWYRIGLIALFTYFVSLSLLMALLIPAGLVLWANGWLSQDLLLQPGWGALYSGVQQLTNLLVLPIWLTCFTLLYFDNRVRKEGYDVELLAMSLAPAMSRPIPSALGMPLQPAFPGGFGQPAPSAWVAAPPQFSRPPGPPFSPAVTRPYMQTGPLGLGGYTPRRPAESSGASPSDQAPPTAPAPRGYGSTPSEMRPVQANAGVTPPGLAPGGTPDQACPRCGHSVRSWDRFCYSCGWSLGSASETTAR